MIYKEICNSIQLQEEFRRFDRDYYSPAAYDAMFDYLEEGDEDYCLDVIELCGFFSEYSEDELIHYYGNDFRTWASDRFYIDEYIEENSLDVDKMSVEDFEKMYNAVYEEYADEWQKDVLGDIKVYHNIIELDNGDYLMCE